LGLLPPGRTRRAGSSAPNTARRRRKFEEAKAADQQGMLTAFPEISNALIFGRNLAEVRTCDQQAVLALESSVQIATELYINEKSSYFEVLQAQQERYPAQRAQVQTQASELISVVQLYKALGGGWQTQVPSGELPAGH
jgi:multidrug efflux system outer membrane protein